jgi:hypothetical protein
VVIGSVWALLGVTLIPLCTGARSLVLDLFKFLHISRAQSGHGLSDSFVSEIAPMPQTVAREVKGEGEELPSVAELVKVRPLSHHVTDLKMTALL